MTGTVTNPFPATASVVVPLPLPVSGRMGILSELTCEFTLSDARSYGVSWDTMWAVYYIGWTPLGNIEWAGVANMKSKNVEAATTAILRAVAARWAVAAAYAAQVPPQLPPENPALMNPLSRDNTTTLDGTQRYRGFCSGIRALDPLLVATVDVRVPAVWSRTPEG